jgi:hypothetical protein
MDFSARRDMNVPSPNSPKRLKPQQRTAMSEGEDNEENKCRRTSVIRVLLASNFLGLPGVNTAVLLADT